MNFWGVAAVSVSGEGTTPLDVGKGGEHSHFSLCPWFFGSSSHEVPPQLFCVGLALPGQGADLQASRTGRARWIAKPVSRSTRSPRRTPLETPSSLLVLPDLTTPQGLPPDGPASVEPADTALGLSSQQSLTSPGQGAHSSTEERLQGSPAPRTRKKRVMCSRRKPSNADSLKDS